MPLQAPRDSRCRPERRAHPATTSASCAATVVPRSSTYSGHRPTPFRARPCQSNFSPGSSLRSGCDVAVGDDVACRDRVARQDGEAQVAYHSHLQGRKIAITPFVARIDDLDADRARVQLRLASPVRDTGVPGAPFLRNEAQCAAVFVHDVMRRHARHRITQPIDRILRTLHASVMQDQRVDRYACRPIIMVRAWQFPDLQRHRARSRLIRSQAALMRATLSLARSMNSAGTPREARLSG